MRRAHWLVAVFLGAGCSLIFDPSKAPIVPCEPSACPSRAHASSRCVQNDCAWSCAIGFADTDGDLASSTSNGCEDSCTTPLGPAELHAMVGVPSGGIQWLWDPPDAGAAQYLVCTGTAQNQLTSCSTVSAATACAQPKGGFACSAQRTGLPNNVRHYGRVQTIDRCQLSSAETLAPTRSATPFNGELATLNDLTVEAGCVGKTGVDGGVLRMSQSGLLCIGALLFGDDEWRDFTLHADTRVIDSSRVFYGGLAFHYPTGTQKQRRAVVLVSDSTNSEVTAALATLTPGTNFDKLVATSIGPVEGNRWMGVELISSGPEVAVAVGPAGSSPKPVLRWREPSGVGGAGRFGLYLGTFGWEEAIEFRNVTVSTRAVLPDAGTGSRKLDFKGSGLPPGIRVTPVGSSNVKMVTCPTFPGGSNCPADGGCQPSAGSNCVEIAAAGLASNTSLTFDQPLGLDPTRPWRLSFKFAPTAVAANAQILRTLSGKGSVLKGPPAAWNGKLWAFGVETTADLAANTWNRVDFRFGVSTWALELNGVNYPVPPLFPPSPEWDAHLGALILAGQDGNQGQLHGYWTDIEIAQPP